MRIVSGWSARACLVLMLAGSVTASTGLAQDPPVEFGPGDVVVIDRDTEGTEPWPNKLRGAVLEVDRLTGEQHRLVWDAPFLGPQDAAFTPEGVMYVIDRTTPTGQYGGALFKVNPFTGSQIEVSSGRFFLNPRTILWSDEYGKFLVVDPRDKAGQDRNHGGILAVDPLTGDQEIVRFAAQFREPIDLILEPEGTYLIIDESAGDRKGPGVTGTVWRWDPLTDEISVLATDNMLVRPRAGEIGPDGALYLADYSSDPDQLGAPPSMTETGSIIRIDRFTGEQSLISAKGLFLRPFALTFDKDGSILVSDRGINNPDERRGFLVRVDPETGDQTLVSNGQYFYQCVSVMLVPDRYPDIVLDVSRIAVGRRARLDLDGMDPNKLCFIFFSYKGHGETYIRQLDVTLDLERAKLLVFDNADENGHFRYEVVVGDNIAPGRTILFQAAARSNDGVTVTSAVVRRVVEE